MTALCPASEVIERNQEQFINKHVLFAGDLQDNFPAQIDVASARAHCSYYHQWMRLKSTRQVNAEFALLATAEFVEPSDTLVFYWLKNKMESQFQLFNLLNKMKPDTAVFIVGENRSGVRSVETILAPYGMVTKVDTARRCSLYYFECGKTVNFDLADWWKSYQVDSTQVKILPGVFSHDGLDAGSALLLSVLKEHPEWLHGQVLDMGCGAGILAAKAQSLSPDIHLTLSDVNAAALTSSEATLAANNIKGRVVASDMFSDVDQQFDVIITNPPFHEGRQVELTMTQRLIKGAKSHLKPGGTMLLVANGFLPYPDLLDATFGHHEVVAQTNQFKVYRVNVALHPAYQK